MIWKSMLVHPSGKPHTPMGSSESYYVVDGPDGQLLAHPSQLRGHMSYGCEIDRLCLGLQGTHIHLGVRGLNAPMSVPGALSHPGEPVE